MCKITLVGQDVTVKKERHGQKQGENQRTRSMQCLQKVKTQRVSSGGVYSLVGAVFTFVSSVSTIHLLLLRLREQAGLVEQEQVHASVVHPVH